MKHTQFVGPWALFLFALLPIACVLGEGYTVKRPLATPPDIPIQVVERPKLLRRGESGTFSLKTDPGNTCWAGIDYHGESGAWNGQDLPEEKADKEGLCTWVWTAPLKAGKGLGHFYPQVGRGGEIAGTLPWGFCIEECDD
jgi:hypothetical protein